MPEGQQVLGGGQAAGEVGRADARDLPAGQAERIDDDQRQARPNQRGEVALAHIVDHVDDRLAARDW